MKWLLQYVIGMREPAGKAATIGTICHYVLECVARAKKLRDIGRKSEQDKIVGRVTVDYDIQDLIDKSYEHFTKKESHINWDHKKDYREVCLNIEKAQRHELFPENHKEIIRTESFFNLAAESPWGEYAYLKDGNIETGNINLVGVIDLIYRDDDGLLNVVDYKFGQPKDWNTGEKKSYATIIKDIQLCMYYYAMNKMFPGEDINLNLWFVKHKLVFSDIFGAKQENILLEKIKSCLNQIRSMKEPKTNYSFRCNYCAFKNTSFEDWGRSNLDMDYNKVGHLAKFDPVNNKLCVCDASKTFIDYRGLEATINAMSEEKK